jgi:hypothetical protein
MVPTAFACERRELVQPCYFSILECETLNTLPGVLQGTGAAALGAAHRSRAPRHDQDDLTGVRDKAGIVVLRTEKFSGSGSIAQTRMRGSNCVK